jgi:dTDP-4-dehydrorhamnose reductase
MKILLTGKTGQLGWELERILPAVGDVVALDRQGLDLAGQKSIRRAVAEVRPHLIVNAAAYTAVDLAEDEPELAHAINAEGPGILAEEAKKIGAALIHYSTDYVFDGRKTSPYTEDDPTGPLNVYGRTKLAGEQAIQAVGVPHLIFRTSWVYSTRGKNFLLTILRLASEREELRIVNDQIGCPNWSRSLAEATIDVVKRISEQAKLSAFGDFSGIYHMSGVGETTWYEFAKGILQKVSHPSIVDDLAIRLKAKRVIPIPTSEFPTRVQRPIYSVLSCSKLLKRFGIALPEWSIQLARISEKQDLEDICSPERVALKGKF